MDSLAPGLLTFVEVGKANEPASVQVMHAIAESRAAIPDDDASWIIDHLPDSLKDKARLWLPLHLPTNFFMLLTPVFFGISMVVLAAVSFLDFSPKGCNTKGIAAQVDGKPQMWPLWKIVALTSFRFHTGFLSATWMPYLLAMEGGAMVESKQSV